MPTNSEDLARVFCQLSAVLTGESSASPITAERHLQTLRAAGDAEQIDAMLQRFADLTSGEYDPVQAVKDHLINDPTFGPAVKRALLLWYTGSTEIGQRAALGSQEDYFEALMWSAVGAHPPGLSNGYYGHWRYPPDMGV